MKTTSPVAAVTIVLALALTACASKLTKENLNKIHSGMSVDEVKSILGSPASVGSLNRTDFNCTTFVYHNKTADVSVVFINDKVSFSRGDFQ